MECVSRLHVSRVCVSWRVGVLAGLAALAAAAAPAVAQEPPGETATGGGTLVVSVESHHRVDAYTPQGERLGSAITGLAPRAVTYREGMLYVANRGPERAPGSSLTIVDLESMRPVRTVLTCLGCAPNDLVFDEEDALWVVGQADRAVYRLKPPYVEPYNSIIVTWGWPTQLAVVEGMGSLVVGMRASEDLAIVDTRKSRAVPLTIGPTPDIVVSRPGAPEAWAVADPMGHLGQVTVRGDAGPPVAALHKIGEFPNGAAFTPDGRRVLVSVGEPMQVVVYDAESLDELSVLPVSARPGAIAMGPTGDMAAVLLDDNGRFEILMVSVDADGRSSPESRFDVDGKISDILWIP